MLGIDIGLTEMSESDYKNLIVTICKDDNFKHIVSNTINDEHNWKDLLRTHKMSLKTKTSESKDDINDKLAQIPAIVVKELREQIPKFLNDSYQMQQILVANSNNLNSRLYESSKQILDNLTNENEYHAITASHLNSMTDRFDASSSKQLHEHEMAFNNAMAKHDETIKSKLFEIESNVSECLGVFSEFNKTAGGLSVKISKLENNVMEIHWNITVSDCVLLVTAAIATITAWSLYNHYID